MYGTKSSPHETCAHKQISRQNVTPIEVMFVHLTADRDIIHERMTHREDHFMPASLVQSQFEDLETLTVDEPHIEINVNQPLNQVMCDIRAKLSL